MKGHLCKTHNGMDGSYGKKGWGKRHTRYCRAYKSCEDFVGITKKGGNARDRRNMHIHLCNGGSIWENLYVDYFSI